MRRLLVAAFILTSFVFSASAVTLEQIISREDPTFNCQQAAMAFGRDGMVYLASSGNNSYALRMAPDGKNKMGSAIVYAVSNGTANADADLPSFSFVVMGNPDAATYLTPKAFSICSATNI